MDPCWYGSFHSISDLPSETTLSTLVYLLPVLLLFHIATTISTCFIGMVQVRLIINFALQVKSADKF